MKNLADTDETLLIRTDHSDQAAWQALLTAVTTPNKNGFLANVHVVDDVAYSDLTTEQAVSVARARGDLLIVADTTALTGPEMPLLAVLPFHEDEDDDYDEDEDEDEETKQEHGELRVIAAELWSIENNISLANMDWEDFVNAADEGVSGASDPGGSGFRHTGAHRPVRPGPRRSAPARGGGLTADETGATENVVHPTAALSPLDRAFSLDGRQSSGQGWPSTIDNVVQRGSVARRVRLPEDRRESPSEENHHGPDLPAPRPPPSAPDPRCIRSRGIPATGRRCPACSGVPSWNSG
ncbi:DUF6924 domain-containing protein [[Kitasatospora] papulosa]|uniref:DUF6924 domain-containing protein n=2 Tax=Streptomyces TaxID=1883 RepID=UPI00368E6E3E